jgi:hypothetical protein
MFNETDMHIFFLSVHIGTTLIFIMRLRFISASA